MILRGSLPILASLNCAKWAIESAGLCSDKVSSEESP
ncbi:hypothetical protein C5167_000259 [Papaver somniferum]|nr:hypothetical protein C5167_000259 [Papaver somniferum]